jgi:hypothetical protein
MGVWGRRRGIEAAIRDSLRDFLGRHASEVLNMLFGEWNMDTAKEVWYEEGYEKGQEEATVKYGKRLRRTRNGSNKNRSV